MRKDNYIILKNGREYVAEDGLVMGDYVYVQKRLKKAKKEYYACSVGYRRYFPRKFKMVKFRTWRDKNV